MAATFILLYLKCNFSTRMRQGILTKFFALISVIFKEFNHNTEPINQTECSIFPTCSSLPRVTLSPPPILEPKNTIESLKLPGKHTI